jgi:hypothetical protein
MMLSKCQFVVYAKHLCNILLTFVPEIGSLSVIRVCGVWVYPDPFPTHALGKGEEL